MAGCWAQKVVVSDVCVRAISLYFIVGIICYTHDCRAGSGDGHVCILGDGSTPKDTSGSSLGFSSVRDRLGWGPYFDSFGSSPLGARYVPMFVSRVSFVDCLLDYRRSRFQTHVFDNRRLRKKQFYAED